MILIFRQALVYPAHRSIWEEAVVTVIDLQYEMVAEDSLVHRVAIENLWYYRRISTLRNIYRTPTIRTRSHRCPRRMERLSYLRITRILDRVTLPIRRTHRDYRILHTETCLVVSLAPVNRWPRRVDLEVDQPDHPPLMATWRNQHKNIITYVFFYCFAKFQKFNVSK